MDGPRATIRIDKWLWYARFFKTRGLAGKAVSAGHVRLNSVRVAKGAQSVGTGDTLTFAQGRQIRVVRITDLGTRRGPAPEAQTLFDDLTPAVDPAERPPPRAGRPSRDDRRRAAKLKRFDLD